MPASTEIERDRVQTMNSSGTVIAKMKKQCFKALQTR
jgi:hypothetical protein